jgi:hypothetical protein
VKGILRNSLIVLFLSFSWTSAQAEQICGAISIEFERFNDPMKECVGELDFDAAIKCVNRLKAAVKKAQRRETYREGQVECLCNSLMETSGTRGGYNGIKGTCDLE